MRLHWDKDEDGLHCMECGDFGGWYTFVPLYPPEPKPGDRLTMICTGTIMGTYCPQCAKRKKDQVSRD